MISTSQKVVSGANTCNKTDRTKQQKAVKTGPEKTSFRVYYFAYGHPSLLQDVHKHIHIKGTASCRERQPVILPLKAPEVFPSRN